MPSQATPQCVLDIIAYLQERGFGLVVNEPPTPSFGDRRMVLSNSALDIWIVRDRSDWSIYVGRTGHGDSLYVWKACLEGTEVRVGTDGIEWETDFIRRYLETMEEALSPGRALETELCLKTKREDANKRAFSPIPTAPWSLDIQPRPGVHVHFGIRWRDDSGLVLPEISVSNESETPFILSATDFELDLNGPATKVFLGSSAHVPSEVAPCTTWRYGGSSAWSWKNVRPLHTVRLSYESSDPAARQLGGFWKEMEWRIDGQ
jgi:hypothetical protein